MIPGVDLIDFIKMVGVLGIALVVFAESGLLIGFFLPGDSLLFTAGFLTYTGYLPVNIHLLVLILFIAAVVGDSVGYAFGRKLGPHVFKRPDSLLFKQENVLKAQHFYEKHGGKTIIIARFIPIVRTFAPVVAGVGKMNYKQFLSYNIIGGLLWAAGLTYLGYYVGTWFTRAGIEIDHVLLPIIFVIIFISVLPPAIHILKDKQQRTAIWNGTKRQLATVFAKRK
ncbi:MAG TPA: VTT domain-containing protein [Candidatus Saccharimonadales bacterium]|jgi:membrane-associated protein|nr:VTT domain-containing protein [Candidatus Saccharimonadales bacterium]